MAGEYTPMGTKSLINELQRFAANVVLRVIVGTDWQIQRLLNAEKQAPWISKWHFDIGSIPHRMTTAVGDILRCRLSSMEYQMRPKQIETLWTDIN